jgi:hypothetical protein
MRTGDLIASLPCWLYAGQAQVTRYLKVLQRVHEVLTPEQAWSKSTMCSPQISTTDNEVTNQLHVWFIMSYVATRT